MSVLSEVSVNTGMFGYMDIADGILGPNRTIIDTDQPLNAAGALSRVKIRMYGTASNFCTVAKLAILRGSAPTYDIIGRVDIKDHLNAAAVDRIDEDINRWEYDTAVTYNSIPPVSMVDITTGLPIEVESGDLLAIFVDASISNVLGGHGAGGAFNVVSEAGDVLSGATATINDTTTADESLMTEAFVLSAESTIYDNSAIVVGTDIVIPSFENGIYTITFEDVVVPDGEDLKLNIIMRTDDNAADRNDNNVYLDMTQAAGADVIQLRDLNDSVWNSKTITFATDDVYDISMIIDTEDATAQNCFKANFVNYQNGQGPIDNSEDSKDIAHVSISDEDWRPRSTNPWNFPPRILQFTQGTGSAATIGRIIVTRKKVVVVGDSFTSKKNLSTSPVELSGVGLELSDAGRWAQDRFVVNGGVPGNILLKDISVVSSIAHRFSGVGQNLEDFPNSVYVFVNGPGVNDFNATSAEEAEAKAEALSSQIRAMATQAITTGSEVVLNEICYIEDGYVSKGAFDDLTTELLNEKLAKISYELQVPIAQTAAAIAADPDTYYNPDHLHLTIAGYELIADEIVRVCENNIISDNPNPDGCFFIQDA